MDIVQLKILRNGEDIIIPILSNIISYVRQHFKNTMNYQHAVTIFLKNEEQPFKPLCPSYKENCTRRLT